MVSLVSLLKYLATLPEEKPEGLFLVLTVHHSEPIPRIASHHLASPRITSHSAKASMQMCCIISGTSEILDTRVCRSYSTKTKEIALQFYSVQWDCVLLVKRWAVNTPRGSSVFDYTNQSSEQDMK
jgi:hypothetical protein